jgi:hypothetical protein
MARIPASNHASFKKRVRSDVRFIYLSTKRAKLELAARNKRVSSCANNLAQALGALNEDAKARLEIRLQGRERLLTYRKGDLTTFVTIRRMLIDDVIGILDRIIEVSTEEVRIDGASSPGRPRGAVTEAGRPFQSTVLKLLRAVDEASGNGLTGKRLLRAFALLRPFASNVIPQTVPERTVKRLKAQTKRRAKYRTLAGQAAERVRAKNP